MQAGGRKEMFDIVREDEALDWISWLNCRSASKQETCAVNERNERKLRMKLIYLQMKKGQEIAATAAAQLISVKTWNVHDPRCCYVYCQGNTNGQTGVWMPRHVPLMWLEEVDAILVESLWWKNGKSDRKVYTRCSPQQTVEQGMRRSHEDNPTKKFYVVCCEACGEAVDNALNILHMGTVNRYQHEIVLGVERLILSSDRADHSEPY
jgi:hypothetical protein